MSNLKVPDFATGKSVDTSKPEERVRQDFEEALADHGYAKGHIDIEVVIQRGSAARERALVFRDRASSLSAG